MIMALIPATGSYVLKNGFAGGSRADNISEPMIYFSDQFGSLVIDPVDCHKISVEEAEGAVTEKIQEVKYWSSILPNSYPEKHAFDVMDLYLNAACGGDSYILLKGYPRFSPYPKVTGRADQSTFGAGYK